MKAFLMAALVAAVALAGCTDNGDDKYTVPEMDDQGRYVIEVGPDGTNTFAIRYAKVPVGATVVWVNHGLGEPHNVAADDERFSSEISKDAWEFEWTFTDAETFTYHCLPHRGVGMTGEVLVQSRADFGMAE